MRKLKNTTLLQNDGALMYLAILSQINAELKEMQIFVNFQKRLPIDSPILYLIGSALKRVYSYKYLSIVISSDLSWSNCIKGIASARKQIGLLYHSFYKHAHQDTLRALYVALIRPQLEYGIPVSHHLLNHINDLDAVHEFATTVGVKSWNTVETGC